MLSVSDDKWLREYEQADNITGETASAVPADTGSVIELPSSAAGDGNVFHCEGDPLIPEGEYLGEFMSCSPVDGRWGGKLVMEFEVAVEAYNHVRLMKYYNIEITGRSPIREKVQWKPKGPKSDYVRDMKRLFGKRRSYSPDLLKGKALVLRVKTVTKDGRDDLLGEANHYSKVDRIMDIKG